MCKITPIHNNQECRKNGIVTIDSYTSYHPYKKPENGFDVLVFVPSMDEETGTVTCGNLILGGDVSLYSFDLFEGPDSSDNFDLDAITLTETF